MSKWKPGQIVTIKGKRYRITKNTVDFEGIPHDCTICDHYNMPQEYEPCYTCLWGRKMPDNCYLKEIKPKIDNYQNERKCCNNRTSSRTS